MEFIIKSEMDFFFALKVICLLQVTTSLAFVRRKQSQKIVIFLQFSKYLKEISIYSLNITFQVKDFLWDLIMLIYDNLTYLKNH